MTCPRCLSDVESGRGACPECGVQLLRNISGMIKTSAVMIATEGERSFFRSVQEVPEPLRQKLLRVTSGDNAGTIVIADRAGKEQLTQGAARREAARRRGDSDHNGLPAVIGNVRGSFFGLSWVVWAGIILLLCSTGIVVVVFSVHR
jgi:hypothetical protein